MRNRAVDRTRRLPRYAAAPAVVLAALLVLPDLLEAQFASASTFQPSTRPRVFMDCQSGPGGGGGGGDGGGGGGMNFGRMGGPVCDQNHFRTEITFVDWVSERTDADVHVIFTSQGAAGGGQRYTLDFTGRGSMQGLSDQLTYTSSGNDVRAETVDGVTQALGMGLLRYAVQAGQGRHFDLRYNGPAGEVIDGDGGAENGAPAAFYDPWNYWTFRVGLSGNMDIQELRNEYRINPQLHVNRVTDTWKINTQLWANLRRQSVEMSDGRIVHNNQDSWRVNALVVRSISDHISVGAATGVNNSTRFNQRARASFQPAVEWNYYPYQQATRRQLIAHYSTGIEHSNYYETTAFGKDRETLPQHRFALQYRAREQWGNAGVAFDASQYLHSSKYYSYGFSGDVSLRVARGLELNFSAGASRIADELYTAESALSDEDILLGRVNLPTSFRYDASVGLNYRWGSTLTNVVNNRFPRNVTDFF